ncbi:hypothetical protein CMsap09_05120 [Clavibacter michiganensis]|uniref:Integral membrane protein n=1 Tax=Clavibacter michiganensis TaxID=28447 RepID=A0A251XSP9_9MICO|nr:hypothetical protein CMsap09_05120 [Clavibacter michiganensis]
MWRYQLNVSKRAVWPLVVVVGVLVGAVIPLLVDPGYYFVDDSQSGLFGQWYEIGNRVLAGEWALVVPQVWQSGNYLAEGAWGLFSPALWLIGVGSHQLPDAVVYVTLVKLVFLVVAGLGAQLLARTFGIPRSWAAVTGIAAPLAGFTLYMDAPSWANGLMAYCLWPLAWALARRTALLGRSAVPAVIVGATLIGFSYAAATIFLGLVLGSTLFEAWRLKRPGMVLRAFWLSVALGSFAVIVHLPGLLTAPVTGRTDGIINTGLLTVNLSGLFTSSTPVGSPQIYIFDRYFPLVPMLYIAWFLPLLAFVDWSRLVRLLRSRSRRGILVVLVAATIGVLLPSDFAVFRFPVRMMPYLTLAVLLITALALGRARVARVTRRRVLFAVGFVVASSALTDSQTPAYWKVIVLAAVASIAGVLLAALVIQRRRAVAPDTVTPVAGDAVTRMLAVLAIAGTLLFLVPQHLAHPSSPLRNYDVPADVADYQRQLTGAEGDVLVVGTVADDAAERRQWADTLVANLWYVNPAQVQNAYSSVYFPAYQDTLCMAYNGYTCYQLFSRLFTIEPQTGERYVDLLSVSSIQLIKESFPTDAGWSRVPDGWHVASDTALTRLLVRDEPLPTAGGVVWQSDGTRVTEVDRDDSGVRFRVDEVPADGGSVALSRIPWPGYSASEGEVQAEPVAGFLTRVDLDGASPGDVVDVTFRSPGWQVQSLAGILVLLGLGVIEVHRFRARHRRHAVTSAPAAEVRA